MNVWLLFHLIHLYYWNYGKFSSNYATKYFIKSKSKNIFPFDHNIWSDGFCLSMCCCYLFYIKIEPRIKIESYWIWWSRYSWEPYQLDGGHISWWLGVSVQYSKLILLSIGAESNLIPVWIYKLFVLFYHTSEKSKWSNYLCCLVLWWKLLWVYPQHYCFV